MSEPSVSTPGAAVRAVVFDLFDTLVDLRMDRLPRVPLLGRSVPGTHGLLHQAVAERAGVDFDTFSRALIEVDRRFRESYLREHRELPTRERFRFLAEQLGIDDDELPEILTRIHMGALRGIAVPPPHHASLLARLRSRYRLGVCSNFSDAASARAVLRETGLLPHLDAVGISEDVGLRKPRPEIFERVLSALDVAPEEAVHVGDSLSADIGGAAALGIRTAWLTRRVPDPRASRQAHPEVEPTWIIQDLAELPDLLARQVAPKGTAA